ncbi:hydroxymethylglutaryl-CoA lyase [Bacillus sp. FJAT-49705]|uniref:Hydroxymethylglutaryl-CoA lyase n=1 Tax=Cytobacillus citreus TaxID=2833586 RepID=A0ABS5P120_9BACI|nr:hydroxymethylglutaryl-CoA lyase [Cytobacillus citreus]MBS4192979.1 hydroxymethylglutaryl-CoA lyase [Cytobacillus citreus]
MGEISIIEVSPRDGLQNDAVFIPTVKKIKLIYLLAEAGINHIEASSFVHPKKVPQMADAEEVIKSCSVLNDTEITALIPNVKGFERATKFPINEVNWVTAATETFNQRNIGISIEDNFKEFTKLKDKTDQTKIKMCFSIAVSFGCPYEGKVNPDVVLKLVERAVEAGADRIGIADTIGIADPEQTYQLLSRVLEVTGKTPVAIHLHDTRGLGLTNAYAAFNAGVRIFETSASGIGGCPFAPGAAGNLATEDLVYMFNRMSIDTGINFERLLDAADYAASLSSNAPLGRIRQVVRIK